MFELVIPQVDERIDDVDTSPPVALPIGVDEARKPPCATPASVDGVTGTNGRRLG